MQTPFQLVIDTRPRPMVRYRTIARVLLSSRCIVHTAGPP